MPTNAIILANAPIATVLAANRIAKGVMFGPPIDPQLDQKIYSTFFVLKKVYDLDPTYENMTPYCQYLWELMSRYGIMAQAYTGGGGSVAPPTGTQGYPIYITSADFTTSTFYPNTNIFGNNILIFVNEYNRYLLPSEFTISSTGITITEANFNATLNDYNLVIEKVYS